MALTKCFTATSMNGEPLNKGRRSLLTFFKNVVKFVHYLPLNLHKEQYQATG